MINEPTMNHLPTLTPVLSAMVPFVRGNSHYKKKSRPESLLNGPPSEYLAGFTSHSNRF